MNVKILYTTLILTLVLLMLLMSSCVTINVGTNPTAQPSTTVPVGTPPTTKPSTTVSSNDQNNVSAANTEAHNVQTAVVAYMADNTLADFDGNVGPATRTGPEAYLVKPTELQAIYTFTDGAISGATPLASGKWKNLTYIVGIGWHQ